MTWQKNMDVNRSNCVVLRELIHPRQKLQNIQLRPFLSGHTCMLEMDAWYGWATKLLVEVTADKVEMRDVDVMTDAMGKSMKKLMKQISAKEALITASAFALTDADGFEHDMMEMLDGNFMMRRLMFREGKIRRKTLNTRIFD
ncbi:hypothetical protein PMAYCL1PPCAC_31357 [Pristionchus mayeri]|uniref:Uncharacterized protein n=1 Tax=Pristionchus mayeri TaxID=1317129 RepID=A0AAN5DFJ3_9BILA|nr:hypothetical protein PMAYCL1PPCAC_31357 [Pristionchus mayeri]